MLETIVTAKIKILPTLEQRIILDDTLRVVKDASNYASEIAHTQNTLSSFKGLHYLAYKELRNRFGLKSQMTCNICTVVAGTYASMKSNKSNALAIYKHPKIVYYYNRDYSFKRDGLVSISTLSERIKLEYIKTGLEHYFDGTWEYGAATLVKKKGKYYLHIAFKKDIPVCLDSEITNVVGVDLGINYLATAINTSNQMMFISGKSIKNKRGQYKRTRKSLQKKGTASARRRLKKIGNRENRWMQDVNHCASKALVNFAGDNSLIVLEDLSGIRTATEKVYKKNRYYTVSWAFYDLRQKIEYKAKLNGTQTVAVDPKYTSQKCPICGYTAKDNRDKKTHIFSCKSCGYTSNDDRIGAMNLRQMGIEYRHVVSASV